MSKMTQKNKRHKVQVTFTDLQWELINKARGYLGESTASVVRNIVISWLAEKSIVSASIKKKEGAEK